MRICFQPNCLTQNHSLSNYCQRCVSNLILNDRFFAVKILGEYPFSRSFLAKDQQNYCYFIKQFFLTDKTRNSGEDLSVLFNQNVIKFKALAQYDHIPKLLDSFTEGDYLYLIHEFIEGENLLHELTNKGNFKEDQIGVLLINILNILNFVHGNNFIHGNIKPENIIRRNDNQLFLVNFFELNPVSFSQELIAKDLSSLGFTCLSLLTEIKLNNLFDLGENALNLCANSVSNELVKILAKLVEKAPEKAYQSADEVLNDLNYCAIFLENKSDSSLVSLNIFLETVETVPNNQISYSSELISVETREIISENYPNYLTEFYPLKGIISALLNYLDNQREINLQTQLQEIKNITNPELFNSYLEQINEAKSLMLTEYALNKIHKTSTTLLELAEKVTRYYNDHKASREEAQILAKELRQLSIHILQIQSFYDLNFVYKMITLLKYQVSRFKHKDSHKYSWDYYIENKILNVFRECWLKLD